MIIDKCHFKIGKARPFDLFNILMWLLLMLCFEVPGFNTVGKVIYVFLMYNMCQSICYTFVSVASPIRVKRSFVEDVRAKALTYGSLISAILGTVLGIVTPILISMFEHQPHGWLIITGVYAVPGILMSLVMFFLVPEMENPEEMEAKREENKESIIESVKLIFQNPNTVLVIIMIFANTLAQGIGMGAQTYYFTYNVGNLALASIVGLISLVGYVVLPVTPAIIKKLGNRKSSLLFYTVLFVSGVGRLVMPKSVLWLAICTSVTTVSIASLMNIRELVLIDCMRFGQLKSGKNYEGIYASVRGFSDKIATGLVGFFTGIILDIGHFDGTVAVQPASALTSIAVLYAVIPSIMAALGFIAMYFNKMEKQIKEMEQAKQEQNA